MILLDTDAVTFLERRQNVESLRLRSRLTELSAEHQIATTIVTYEEQTRGWMAMFARAKTSSAIIDAYDDLLQHFETFKSIEVVPYSAAADAHFQRLRKQKIRIGTRDLRIASVALSLEATLLSRNLHDFQQVPALSAEDWTSQ